MIIRVRLRNGDVRQGTYMNHSDRFLWLNDGRARQIELIMIDTVDPVGDDVSPAKPFQTCLEIQ